MFLRLNCARRNEGRYWWFGQQDYCLGLEDKKSQKNLDRNETDQGCRNSVPRI